MTVAIMFPNGSTLNNYCTSVVFEVMFLHSSWTDDKMKKSSDLFRNANQSRDHQLKGSEIKLFKGIYSEAKPRFIDISWDGLPLRRELYM